MTDQQNNELFGIEYWKKRRKQWTTKKRNVSIKPIDISLSTIEQRLISRTLYTYNTYGPYPKNISLPHIIYLFSKRCKVTHFSCDQHIFLHDEADGTFYEDLPERPDSFI